jgi:N-acyl-D-aspartate/D-glutamate deacylase
MPTWNIAHYTRDRVKGEKIPLEFLVRKQTKETAETFGLMDRGQIKEGYMADINIIDHENLCVYKPEMVHDLPTGSRRIIQKAGGYIATIKSGVATFKNDEPTGELPGTVLRGERTAEAISA